MKPIVITATILVSSLSMQLHAGGVDELIKHYLIQTKSKTSSFAGFDSNRGKDLYLKKFGSSQLCVGLTNDIRLWFDRVCTSGFPAGE